MQGRSELMVKFFSLKKHCCNSVLLSLSKSRLKYFVTITVVTKVSCIFVTSGFLNFSFFLLFFTRSCLLTSCITCIPFGLFSISTSGISSSSSIISRSGFSWSSSRGWLLRWGIVARGWALLGLIHEELPVDET